MGCVVQIDTKEFDGRMWRRRTIPLSFKPHVPIKPTRLVARRVVAISVMEHGERYPFTISFQPLRYTQPKWLLWKIWVMVAV